MVTEKMSTVYRLEIALLAVAVSLGMLAGCRDGGSKEATGDQVAQATAAATAILPPPDIELAQRLERNGELDEARDAYEAVVSRGRESERPQARIALARIALTEEDFAEAREQMLAYVDEAGEGADLRQAHLLLAEAAAGLGENDEALRLYQQYVDEGGVAAGNIRIEVASRLLALGRVDEGPVEAESALNVEGLPESQRPGAILRIAQGLEGAGANAKAVEWYGRLLEESESGSDQALALLHRALLRRELGESDWPVDLRRVVEEYPATASAVDALDELLAAGEPVDGFVEGLVRYRHFEGEKAKAAFESYVEQNPDGDKAAGAHYYLAVILERLGDEESAIGEYRIAYELAPQGEYAAKSLWWRALLLGKHSLFDEASTLYGLLGSLSSSGWAEDAAFGAGMLLYRQERFREAANEWHSLAIDASDEQATRALFWAAKAEMAGGDEAIGRSHLRDLVNQYPFDFYGLRAQALLESAGEPITEPVAATAEGVEAWLESIGGGARLPLSEIWRDARWSRGLEFVAVGYPRTGAAELRSLMWEHAEEPLALWSLANAYRGIGMTELSARSAQLILDGLSPEQTATAPRALLEMAYPQDYPELLASAEASEGVSSLLLLALIRQESFFDPLAGSGAGALGLTQVMPATGDEIAQALGESGFDSRQLVRPVVSIRYGSHYLAAQIERFDGNLYYALAAYNGGPAAADRWRAASGDDVDMLLEQIDADQSKLYVRVVMENLAMYRYLYGDSTRPSLP